MTTTTPNATVTDALVAARPSLGTDAMTTLHERLVRDADQAALLDVAYRVVDSPFGPLLVAATGAGIARLAFECEGHDAVLADLAGSISPRILRSATRTDVVARQLDEYFTGRRHRFDVPFDLRSTHGFRHEVLMRLADIPYGATQSYATLAQATGHPKAARAVGSACAHNPVPVLLPCHRVVRRDGTIGQYLGGTEAKHALLALEAAH
jgi:methylated-DNA-[protein]-cysteine S-methyltransferase